jgi:IPT/TIG domain
MPPVITSLSPNNGPVGTSVLISGSGFISGGLHGVVKFSSNVIATTVYSYTNTSIVVAVPAGAVTGPVFVEVVNVNSNSMTFTVSAPTTPTITSLTPSSGGIGIPVTIAGTNFGATQGTSTVTFNGIVASVSSWSSTSIVATVPLMATTGPVIVTVGGVASNSMTFTVTNPSNGGMGSPLNLLLVPCQQFGTQEVLSFNTFDFNDNSFGSFYNWKVEEIAAGRTPSCTRQIIIFRDLGVATITATLSGYNQNLADNPFVSISETFTMGTAGATQKLGAVVRGLSLTAQNLQYTITRGGGAGPVSITKVRLEGRVEMTAYA